MTNKKLTPKKNVSGEKNKGGRPSEYEDKAWDLIETLNSMGDEGEGMAEAITACGIARDTFYRWKDKYPEFSDAIKAFRLRSQAWWEKNGRKATFGGTDGFNATSYIFNMKNRFPDDWKDKVDLDHGIQEDQLDEDKPGLARMIAFALRQGQEATK